MSTYLLQYREAIRRGETRAGRDMIDELERLIEDMDDPEYLYDTTDAEERIDFIEHCVRLTKAPYYGMPMLLLLWEKAFIEAAYSFKIRSLDTGEWVDRFQEILMMIPRKNGKTELVAALMLTELIIGAPGSDIVCSGMDDGTADLAYTALDTMRLLIDPKSVDTWRNQKGIKCFANNSHVYKLSSSTHQREGRNIDVAAIDEIWSLKADGDIYKSIQQSTSTKERFKIFMFGSEGFVQDGFLDIKRKEYMRIVRGEDDTEAAKRKLPWIYTQDSEREVWDTNSDGINPAWEKSNPSIGTVKKWSYLRDRVDEARRSKIDRVFTLCKDFNFKQNAATSWLDPSDFKYPACFDITEFSGSYALGAVDLAETTDMVSAKILLMRRDDQTKYIYQHYWITANKLKDADDKNAGADYEQWAKDGFLTLCDENEVDLSVVADWFYELYKRYKIRLFVCGYDQRFSKDFLRRMDEYGFKYEMVLQNKATLSTPMRLCDAELKARRVNFNEDPIDNWCLGNAAVEVDKLKQGQIVKQKHEMRIDGAVTLIMLFEMLRRYRSEIIKTLR